jgi:hypothetical protein
MRALAAIVLLTACGGREPSRPAEAAEARARPAAQAASRSAETTAEPAPEPAPPPTSEPDFDAPFPTEPCAPTRVALAHRSAPDLPLLTHAAALRRDDGRHVRVVIAGHPIERDARGRFRALTEGEARFELDAVRTRRGPLEPGALGLPGARRGGLTHVRIVTAGARFTFGHRGIGRVELTAVSGERVCGRVDLDDGFGRVRGAFVAPIAGMFVE